MQKKLLGGWLLWLLLRDSVVWRGLVQGIGFWGWLGFSWLRCLDLWSIRAVTILSISYLFVCGSGCGWSICGYWHIVSLSCLLFFIEDFSNNIIFNLISIISLSQSIIWEPFLLKINFILLNFAVIIIVVESRCVLIFKIRHFQLIFVNSLALVCIICEGITFILSFIWGLDLWSDLFERLIKIVVDFDMFWSNFKR